MPTSAIRGEDILDEFSEVSLPDERLDERLARVMRRFAAAPADSFPEQMANDAELEGLYRFLANDRVTMPALLSGHFRQTQARMAACSLVRILHDTTSFRFEGERNGLGALNRGARGFFAHVALAVGGDEDRVPLGVLAVKPYVYTLTIARRALSRVEQDVESHSRPRSKRVSSRWEELAKASETGVPEGVRSIHIMDQEADDFTLLATLVDEGLSFVIRGSDERPVSRGREKKTIAQVLDTKASTLFRTVRISARSKKQAKTSRSHLPRLERDAELSVRWATVTLPRPGRASTTTKALTVQVVHVFEHNPPPGTDPVDWTLLTSEPVNDIADAAAIVDHYRARWIIEEYFKALKTGCAVEKRQLTSFDGLVRALALFIPIAWKLLALRQLARETQSRPATALFSAREILFASVIFAKRAYVLSASPSVKEFMLGIAKLGGHIKNNGAPGWQVLGRGLERFTDAYEGWELAQ